METGWKPMTLEEIMWGKKEDKEEKGNEDEDENEGED